jgi:phage gp37-like protein
MTTIIPLATLVLACAAIWVAFLGAEDGKW